MSDSATMPATGTSDDIISVLRDQHEQVKSVMQSVLDSTGDARQQAFDSLRVLLAMHETAEEMVLRPVTKQLGHEDVADARNAEEKSATEVLADLERMGCEDAQFLPTFERFSGDVLRHARSEESLEFPAVIAEKSQDEREALGRKLRQVEKTAPTHPHPSTAGSTAAQWTVGPFASMVDHLRDMFSGDGDDGGQDRAEGEGLRTASGDAGGVTGVPGQTSL